MPITSTGSGCSIVTLAMSTLDASKDWARFGLKDNSGEGFVATILELYLIVPEDTLPEEPEEPAAPEPSPSPPPTSLPYPPPPPSPSPSPPPGGSPTEGDEPAADAASGVVLMLVDGAVAVGFRDASWSGSYEYGVAGTHMQADTQAWGAFSVQLEPEIAGVSTWDELSATAVVVLVCVIDTPVAQLQMGLFASGSGEYKVPLNAVVVEDKGECVTARVDLQALPPAQQGQPWDRVFIQDFSGSGSGFEVYGLYLEVPEGEGEGEEDDAAGGEGGSSPALSPPPYLEPPPPLTGRVAICPGGRPPC